MTEIGVDKYTLSLRKLQNCSDLELQQANDLTEDPESDQGIQNQKLRAWGRELVKAISPPMYPEKEREELQKKVAQLEKHILRTEYEKHAKETGKKVQPVGKLFKPEKPKDVPEKKAHEKYKENLKKRHAEYAESFRYTFDCFVKKTKESILIKGNDHKEKRPIAIKFALPSRSAETQRVKAKEEEGKKSVILRGAQKLMGLAYKPQGAQRKTFETEHTERFKRGIEIQRQVNRKMVNKGIVDNLYVPAVYEAGLPPRQYAVMEWIDGFDLVEWASKQTDHNILRFLLRLLKGVEIIIHKWRIIHSDFKPKNVMVSKDGYPYLFDFGIAKCDGVAELTTCDTRLGSPIYASQDQLESTKDRDALDDIVGLGRLMWAVWNRSEIDTSDVVVERDSNGNHIYDDEFYATIRDKYDPDIFPASLKDVFLRATNPDRELRYQDIGDFRRDIELILFREYDQRKSICDKPCKGLVALQKALMAERGKVEELQSIVRKVIDMADIVGKEKEHEQN